MKYAKKLGILSVLMAVTGLTAAACGGDDDKGNAKGSCAACSADSMDSCEETATACAKEGTKAECQPLLDIMCNPLGGGDAG